MPHEHKNSPSDKIRGAGGKQDFIVNKNYLICRIINKSR